MILSHHGGDNVPVGKDKTGVLVNMNKELKVKLEQLAKEDCRSLTSFINKILTDYVKDK